MSGYTFRRVGAARHDNNFDLIRLIAALQVVYGHFVWHLDLWPGPLWLFNISQSFPGVAIFFVVSGFLITESSIRSSSLGSYTVKRARRIYPGLLVNIAIIELALLATGAFYAPPSAEQLVGFYAVYGMSGQMHWAQTLFPLPYSSWGTFFTVYPSGVLWTIGVELTFYAAVPLFLAVWKRSSATGTALIVAAAIASFILAQTATAPGLDSPFVTLSVMPYFWVFALGMLANLYWIHIENVFTERAGYWLAAHLTVAVILYVSGHSAYIPIAQPTAFDAFRIVILCGVVLSTAHTMAPKSKQADKKIDLSYGIYLYHMLVAYTVLGLGYSGQWWLWPFCAAATFAAAALSWHLVERPFLRPKPARPITHQVVRS